MSIEYTEWVNYSEKDFIAAQFLMTATNPPIEIICYHCQQSAEKLFKAFLIKNDIIPSRTHDLNLLVNECVKIENTISILKKECNRLNDFGVNTRYPNNMDLELEDAKIALKDAEKIKEYILSKID
ncbi:MAG: HEPN domain-containing protein [Fusobacteriaceae bacterium]|nr:HEPN domain-containing protein [Fusobacteriaceae bacterium]